MTNTATTNDSANAEGKLTTFTRWLNSNTHTEDSEAMLDRMPLYLRVALRAIYLAGIGGIGWGTYDLFVNRGGMPPLAAGGITVLIETFALVAAFYSVRARLRGRASWHTRYVVYLGVWASAGLQLAFVFPENQVLAVGLSVAGAVALISWMLDVNDRHGDVFAKQAEQRKATRQARRDARRGMLAFLIANTPWRTFSEWRTRTRNVGKAVRNVDTTLALRVQEARLNVIEGEVMNPRPVKGPFVPKPGVAGRPVSAPPSLTITRDDEHGRHMRQLANVTECGKYALTLVDIFGTNPSAAQVSRWLADEYDVTLSASTLSTLKYQVHPHLRREING